MGATFDVLYEKTMRIHILGICGTFMGGLAVLARSLGHEVTGSDANVYPPMSTLLEREGIDLIRVTIRLSWILHQIW